MRVKPDAITYSSRPAQPDPWLVAEEAALSDIWKDSKKRQTYKFQIAKRFLTELAKAVKTSGYADTHAKGIGKGLHGIHRGQGVKVFGLLWKIDLTDDNAEDWSERGQVGKTRANLVVGNHWITIRYDVDRDVHADHSAVNLKSPEARAKIGLGAAEIVSREEERRPGSNKRHSFFGGKGQAEETPLKQAVAEVERAAANLKEGSALAHFVIKALENRGFFKKIREKGRSVSLASQET